VQSFQAIKPTISLDDHTQTFVYSFTAQSEDLPIDENIYTILTIWSQPSDLKQIASQIKEVFSTVYYEDVTADSSGLRFKKSLQAINAGLTEINQYYQKNEKRFHLEGIIAVVSKELVLISSSGEVQAFKISPGEVVSLIDTDKNNTHQNVFSTIH